MQEALGEDPSSSGPNSTFGSRALAFYRDLPRPPIEGDVEAIEPHRDPEVFRLMDAFFTRYFADNRPRVFAIGINPGRHGSGVTGIPFTDPAALAEECEIPNALPKRKELSSEFIYRFINHWGGPARFYNSFFLTSISPIGFTRDGRNLNYYDDEHILAATNDFIVSSWDKQLALGANRRAAIVIGSGANFHNIQRLNDKHAWFDELLVVEHPRYIMQYRRAALDDYLKRYASIFNEAAQMAGLQTGGTER